MHIWVPQRLKREDCCEPWDICKYLLTTSFPQVILISRWQEPKMNLQTMARQRQGCNTYKWKKHVLKRLGSTTAGFRSGYGTAVQVVVVSSSHAWGWERAVSLWYRRTEAGESNQDEGNGTDGWKHCLDAKVGTWDAGDHWIVMCTRYSAMMIMKWFANKVGLKLSVKGEWRRNWNPEVVENKDPMMQRRKGYLWNARCGRFSFHQGSETNFYQESGSWGSDAMLN